ncbi:MAG: glycoside hydrolase [Oscillospiraceae bacterium]|nr:glycoside hydrolase [Oscillospiraceae bacterium]
MKMRNKIAALALCGAMTAAALPVCPVQAADSLTYEFEDGKTDGGKIHTEGWKGNTAEDGTGDDYDLTGFSGTGFSYLDQKGTTVSVEVDVPAAGLYRMNLRYCEPYDPNKKVQYLNINGVNQGEVCFPYCTEFRDMESGVVMLQKGKNTIEFKAYWGYTFFDSLTLTPAPESVSSLSPTRTLSNPNASESTQRLYSYLCDNYGKHILAGQQEYCGDHNYNLYADPTNFIKDNEVEFEYIKETTGKTPAIRGIDFLAYNSSDNWDDHAAERAAQWVTEYGGIATVTWHWNVPSEQDKVGINDLAFYVESANPKYTTFSVKRALTEGTWENERLLADIEYIAKKLQILEDADAPVLFRPLHEAEGAWFWWGAEGAEPCKELYRLLYDKLTNEYGLDNLIWVWTSSTYETSANWYPGDDVVDIIGYDKYNCTDGEANLSAISSTFYSLADSTNGQKMVAMTENDSIPSLENLENEKAAWLWFCPWYQNYLTSEQNNPVASLKEIYNSEYCITLDELPDLKTYPISTVQPDPTDPTKPASTEPTNKPTEPTGDKPASLCGDVNEDGDVTILDVIVLNKNLMVGEPLTEQGKKNAITIVGGTDPTPTDALNILKYVVEIIPELPVE